MNLNPADYTYDLPDDRIAKYPLSKRDESKLLVYQDGEIKHRRFSEIASFIPPKSTLFFNETRVIPARLIFHKSTGARIEIFLLEPQKPSRIMQIAMESTKPVSWNCMIGNLKKWKDGDELILELKVNNKNVRLIASLVNRSAMEVELNWKDSEITFSEIVTAAGKIPLPPYIDREVSEEDKERYQTVYSKVDGAVAAPTAGLHFTDQILTNIEQSGFQVSSLTLHVNAGTFQPLKVSDVTDHPMHSEQVIIRRENLEAILKTESIIAVGTTSLRTLESLFWYGVKLELKPEADFHIEKLYPYEKYHKNLPLKKAISNVLEKMQKEQISELIGNTEIFIFPGYEFKVCNGLITNYHLPGSTLILLVAAFIGEDWRKVYQEAMNNGYRFLSYGDSSLLLK